MHIADDFNLNLLDHDKNREIYNFLNLSELSSVSRKTATSIDHILTNSFIDSVFKKAILKTDISDHFPICLSLPRENKAKNTLIYKKNM